MSPWPTLEALLAALFDENELRTLCSTELYLGDLSAHLPAPGAGASGLHRGVIQGLVAQAQLGPGFFRSLRSLRAHHAKDIALAERVCSARKVLVLHGGVGDEASADRARLDARLARRLTDEMQRAGHRVLLPWPTPPGSPASFVLEAALDSCDALVLLLSAASAEAPATLGALERVAARGWPAVMAVTTDTTMPPPSLVAQLAHASIHGCTEPGAYAGTLAAVTATLAGLLAQGVLHSPRSPGPSPWPPPRGGSQGNIRPGPIGRDKLSALSHPGETIFQEVLTEPVLVQHHQGRTTVVVDRRGVDQIVVTTQAKTALWTEKLGSRAGLEAGMAWDAYFEASLVRGEPVPPPELPCPPLRWGGAGALATVRWRGDDWVPLLFRDIPPVGWNLPLGASGRRDDPTDPAAWGRRELLEELIVLAGTPEHGRPCVLRPLLLPGRAPRLALDEAIQASLQTLALRALHDQLPIVPGAPASLPGHGWLGRAIPCDVHTTSSDLLVLSEEGAQWRRNLLLAPVPLELGIDVVDILSFAMDDEDTILDGEVLERDDGSLELVRMPVAMLRCSAIQRLFGPAAPPLEPTDQLPRSMRCGGLRPADLHVFPWDPRRRRELALGSRMADGALDPREKARYRTWHDRLGRHFLDAAGQPSAQDPCPLFVGATARLLAAWAHQQG